MEKMKKIFAFDFIQCDCTLRQSIYLLYKTPFKLKANLKLILNIILHSIEADNPDKEVLIKFKQCTLKFY